MTEILIVIALIVLIIALAVPAFNLITGTRSVDAGENLVSAMLSRARALAMDPEMPAQVGVAFFLDPDTDRTAMVFVAEETSNDDTAAEPAGMDQYKAWSQFQADGATATSYKKGQIVYRLALNPAAGRSTVQKFMCSNDHASSASSGPPGANWTPLGTTGTNPAIDAMSGGELQYLPAGVGAQLINDPQPEGTVLAAALRERYVRTGLIMFDRQGAVVHRAYTISAVDVDGNGIPDNRLAEMLGRNVGAANSIPAAAGNPTYTQLGVVLYDLQTFRNLFGKDADATDPINDGGASEQPDAVDTQVRAEEKWLDQNSLQLLINRYNGTLVRGE
jgi:hypothetical protein